LVPAFAIQDSREVMPIVTEQKTYKDLQRMFGHKYRMPPETAMKGDVIEYRCPYIPMCPAGAKCFVAATPEPLQENDILNVKCRLCGNKKIPIYAVAVKSS
jgi:hypothetical protein